MRTDLTDVTLVIDRSGSMASCREEAENGVNHFIDEQKKAAGECVFSLVQFDTEYEFVHKGQNIQNVGKFSLKPRGMTALLDAVGRAINEAGDRLAKMPEEQRPALVCFVIVTDGLENSSHEFRRDQIKAMIERQTNEYSWKFTFLGANQDAFAEGASIGIDASASSNFSALRSKAAFTSASASVMRMRSAAASGDEVKCAYTPEERQAMA